MSFKAALESAIKGTSKNASGFAAAMYKAAQKTGSGVSKADLKILEN